MTKEENLNIDLSLAFLALQFDMAAGQAKRDGNEERRKAFKEAANRIYDFALKEEYK